MSIVADGPDRFRVLGPLTFDTVESIPALPIDWAAIAGSVTIDFCEVPKADSAGLALMLEWRRLTQKAGRELVFVNLPNRLHDLIRVNGLQALFPEPGK